MSAAAAPGGAGSAAAPAPADDAAGVRVVDSFAPAARLVAAGAQGLSRALLGAVAAQAEAPVAELAALERATALVGDAWAGVAADAGGARGLLADADALVASLRPSFDALDELEGVVAELEEAARAIDTQTKQLEALFSSLL